MTSTNNSCEKYVLTQFVEGLIAVDACFDRGTACNPNFLRLMVSHLCCTTIQKCMPNYQPMLLFTLLHFNIVRTGQAMLLLTLSHSHIVSTGLPVFVFVLVKRVLDILSRDLFTQYFVACVVA